MSFYDESKALFNETVAVRRELHANPEIGDNVPATVAVIKRELDGIGVKYTVTPENSVVADIGSGDSCVAVRADIDALPVREDTGLPFASQNGHSHSCGHDIHTASLLCAAKILKKHENELNGRVRLMFQSDEEGVTGAEKLIARGVLDGVNCALGLHVASGLPTGLINVQSGGYLASSDIFRITVTGRATHGSMPENGIDPILIGAKIVDGLQTINARMTNAFDPVVVTIGAFNAGTTYNVIPEKAELLGTVRTFDTDVRKKVCALVAEMSAKIASVYGGSAEFCEISSTPVTYNDPSLAEKVYNYSEELLGGDMVKKRALRLKASDDFACYSEKVPSVMFHVGAGTPDQGCRYPLHNPKVVFDENILLNASAVLAYLPYKLLGE